MMSVRPSSMPLRLDARFDRAGRRHILLLSCPFRDSCNFKFPFLGVVAARRRKRGLAASTALNRHFMSKSTTEKIAYTTHRGIVACENNIDVTKPDWRLLVEFDAWPTFAAADHGHRGRRAE